MSTIARVEIPAPADLVADATGAVLSGRPVTLKLAGTATDVTHYSALTGGTSTTGGLVTSDDGTIVDGSGNRRYIDSGAAVDITVAGQERLLQPLSASVESDVGELDTAARKWFPEPIGGDDAAELISRLAAGEKDIAMRRLTYTWGQALGTIPADAAVIGAGKRLTKVEKGFAGDLGTLADGAQLADLTIDGKGASRTGKGFLFAGAAGRQSFRQVRMYDMDDACLEFAQAAGSQSEFIGCTFARYNGISRDVYSVIIDPTWPGTAVPRKFVACETDGTPFIDIGGADDLHVSGGGYDGKFKFSDESRGVLLDGLRIGGNYSSESPASTGDTSSGSPTLSNVSPTTGWLNGMTISGTGIPADTHILSGAGTSTLVLSRNATATATDVALSTSILYVRGHNNVISGDNIGPQPVIDVGASAITIAANSYNNGPVLDISGFAGFNSVDSRRSIYTPTLTGGGTTPDLGNGTLKGYWSRHGSVVTFAVELTLGSTTALGNGDFRVGLPMAAASVIAQVVEGYGFRVATNFNHDFVCLIPASQAYASIRIPTAGAVSATTPFVWTTNDVIRVSGSYQL